jgi:hypothetical protein
MAEFLNYFFPVGWASHKEIARDSFEGWDPFHWPTPICFRDDDFFGLRTDVFSIESAAKDWAFEVPFAQYRSITGSGG